MLEQSTGPLDDFSCGVGPHFAARVIRNQHGERLRLVFTSGDDGMCYDMHPSDVPKFVNYLCKVLMGPVVAAPPKGIE